MAASRAVAVFYLAPGLLPGPANVLLGSRAVGVLAPGALSTATTTLTIPAAAEPGTWRILAIVDEANASPERNDTNNVRVSADLEVTPYRPDLTLTALAPPATVAAGRPLAIRHTVRNAGPAPAGPFTIRFHLSADDALDAADVLLGARALAGLAAGASSAAVSTVTVPAATAVPAAYRVIAVADALAQQTELDETNNTALSAPLPMTAYRPDLTLTTLTVPAAVRAGGSGHQPRGPQRRPRAGRRLLRPLPPLGRRHARRR
jgi:subtilase family serine protease